MKQLLIVGFPESFFTLVVAQEIEEVDAQEVFRTNVPAPDLLEAVDNIMKLYDGIESITLYGPLEYIEKFAKDLSIIYYDVTVHCEKAGL